MTTMERVTPEKSIEEAADAKTKEEYAVAYYTIDNRLGTQHRSVPCPLDLRSKTHCDQLLAFSAVFSEPTADPDSAGRMLSDDWLVVYNPGLETNPPFLVDRYTKEKLMDQGKYDLIIVATPASEEDHPADDRTDAVATQSSGNKQRAIDPRSPDAWIAKCIVTADERYRFMTAIACSFCAKPGAAGGCDKCSFARYCDAYCFEKHAHQHAKICGRMASVRVDRSDQHPYPDVQKKFDLTENGELPTEGQKIHIL